VWAASRDDSRLFIFLMTALITLAWLALWAWGRSPGGLFYGHHGPDVFTRGGAFMLVFMAGWTVMVVAMMLPTSLPLIMLFRTITRRRRDRALLVALLIVGYVGIWTLFGIVVYFGGWMLQQIVQQSGWLETNAWILGTGIVTLAGLYKSAPLKYKCLEKCRSPLSFVMEHWRGSHERSQALRLGMQYGLFCVGCC
jgi:predicted metal-binding membrane protein